MALHESEQHLLVSDDEGSGKDVRSFRNGNCVADRSWRKSALVHLCIFLSYMLTLTLFTFSNPIKTQLHVFQGDLISVKPRHFPPIAHSSFFEGTTEEIDAAFAEILQRPQLRVTKHELETEGKDSLRLPESDGYLAWIGAHHDIHCLQLLRKSFHRREYSDTLDAHAVKQLEQHTDHCLYQLLQTVLCFGDTRLMTFEWNANVTKPILRLSATTDERRCVDWGRLQEGLVDRAVSAAEMSRLENPFML